MGYKDTIRQDAGKTHRYLSYSTHHLLTESILVIILFVSSHNQQEVPQGVQVGEGLSLEEGAKHGMVNEVVANEVIIVLFFFFSFFFCISISFRLPRALKFCFKICSSV